MTRHATLAFALVCIVHISPMAAAQSQGAVPLPAEAQPAAPSATKSAITAPAPEYRLHLSDRLELQFPFSPDYNEAVTVQPDGRISLREAPPVQVAGKSVLQAQAIVEQAYRGILHEPKVSLTLKEFQLPSFYASGEVGHPGRYELHSETTLLQGIAEAGGLLNERARKKEVVVFRPQGNGTYESRVIDVKRLLTTHGTAEDFALAPGDVIYVPQNRASKVQRYLPSTNIGGYVAPAAF